MTAKSLKQVIDSPPAHWVGDGFLVQPMFADFAFGGDISPFLMLDYAAPTAFHPSDNPPGVGAHPHKGFETVTIVYDGEVEHRDSAGNSGRIGPGDVQWMTAGAGLLHEEFHARDAAKRGGLVSMAQLWVNLPAAKKSTPPTYQDIRDATIPRVLLAEGAGEARIIAGEFQGARGPAHTFTPMQVWDIRLSASGRINLPLTEGDNAMLPIFTGRVRIGGQEISAGKVALLERKGDGVVVEALENARLLLLAGAPIDEPIAAYGPFVMNTQSEIRQAVEDFRQGKMGVL